MLGEWCNSVFVWIFVFILYFENVFLLVNGCYGNLLIVYLIKEKNEYFFL